MTMFERADERRQKGLEYQKKIFPLGLEQRDAALLALRPHISNKINDAEALYSFVISKETYLKANGDMDAVVLLLDKRRFLTDSEKASIIALLRLDAAVQNLEDYPTADDVRIAMEK